MDNTTNNKVCMICYDTIPENFMCFSHIATSDDIDNIAHTSCVECVNSFVKANLETYKVSSKCMHPNCNHDFGYNDIAKCLSSEIAPKFKELVEIKKIQDIANSKPRHRYQVCPFCKKYGCDIGVVTRNYKCENCLKHWCKDCRLESHSGNNCWVFPNDVDGQIVIDGVVHIMNTYLHFRCPGCLNHIEKTGGCNHMTCPKCNISSCYSCDQEYILHQTDSETITFIPQCECNKDSALYVSSEEKLKMNKAKIIKICNRIKQKNCKRVRKIITNTMIEHGYATISNYKIAKTKVHNFFSFVSRQFADTTRET